MIVQCPECQTKYNLPDSKISPSGTKVRCSRCSHTFTTFPDGDGLEPEQELGSAPEPKPTPMAEPRPETAAPSSAEAEPASDEDDLGLGDLAGLTGLGDEPEQGGKSRKAGNSGLGADFDEDDFLASLGDLGDLGGGKDPFAESPSDEPSFTDDFLKEDAKVSAPAGSGKKAAGQPDLVDDDIFGALGASDDLDDLLGEKPKPKPTPADDLGLEDIDFGEEPTPAPNSEGNAAARPEPDEPTESDTGMPDEAAWAGLDDEPEASRGIESDAGRDSADEVEQEVGDEDFEAALRNLSMDLDGEENPDRAQPTSRTTSLEQSEDLDDLWPTGDEDEAEPSAEVGSASLSLDEPGASAFADLDTKAKKKAKPVGAGKLLLFLLLFVLLLVGGGVAAIHYLGLWSSLPPWTQDLARMARLPVNGGMAKPMEEQVRLLSLENIRQYTVQNDKAGQVFVIEGKVVNNFPSARELIRVQASLYDQSGNVVVNKDITAGNTVSLFQLQIMSPQEIEAALSSDVGILSNNADVRTGESVPFMAVFFNAPESVAEFGVKVIEASEPAK